MSFLRPLRFAWLSLRLSGVPQWPVEHVARLQRRRLRRLVRHAVKHSPFYGEKYRRVKIQDVDLEHLPPTNKTELMANFDRLVTDGAVRRKDLEQFIHGPGNLGKYFIGRYAVSHTSGSQGQPMLIVQEPRHLELLFALQTTRGNAAMAGPVRESLRRWLRPARLAAVSMRPGFYPSAASFAYMPHEVRSYLHLLCLSATQPDLVQQLNDFKPTVLTAYANVLESLVQRAGELALAPHLEQIVNNSETLTDDARRRIEETFGVPVLDNYALGECTFLSNGCPGQCGAHVNADWAILEVVDDAYRPVAAGSPGKKVLVTNLANGIQPFIRYEVGDQVVMSDRPCGCGSRLPRIDRIEGRATEEFVVLDGGACRCVLGSVFKNACDYLHSVREWQAVQTERNRIEVKLELLPGRHLPRLQAEQVLREKLALFGLPPAVDVTVELVPTLAPDPATGKFNRIVSRVDRPVQTAAEPLAANA